MLKQPELANKKETIEQGYYLVTGEPYSNETPYTFHVIYNDEFTEIVSPTEFAITTHNMMKEREKIIPFTVDSKDYTAVLETAAREIQGVPGLICELGFRAGGGMRFMLEAIIQHDEERICIGIDPYGSMPYVGMEGEQSKTGLGPYPNKLMKTTLKYMYDYLLDYPKINFFLMPMEDTEFFRRYRDGVPVYSSGEKKIVNEYAMVYFDGPHSLESVMLETRFFSERASPGAMFVYDDVQYFYDHDIVHDFLLKNGWEVCRVTKVKAAYQKGTNSGKVG